MQNGRYGIATRNIGCGEVVLVDDSHFNFVTNRGEVCSHCLDQKSIDMIASPLNAMVG